MLKSFTSSYQTCTAVAQSAVQSEVESNEKVMYRFWPTLNLSAIESAKCPSELHKLPLALSNSAYRLASSYEFHYNFTWPFRHFPHSAMICTAHPFSGPTALAVALAECCNVPISQNVHLMYRSSILKAGQDRSLGLSHRRVDRISFCRHCLFVYLAN